LNKKKYDVIIIGGGIVGVGIARDLSMRGLEVALLERYDLATGATGRSHALLHSGGRYVVKDPVSARECAQENLVLRKIASHIIDNVGGLFIGLDVDPPDYAEKFIKGCKETGVKCDELSVKEAIKMEPNLNKNVQRAFLVNDAHIDPFKLTLLNAIDALDAGAKIMTYHEAIVFITNKKDVMGVRVKDNLKNKLKEFYADIIVVAAGAWNRKILSMVNINIEILPNRGTILVISGRIFNRVINRLRMPSDGDIIVPSYETNLLGTTSVNVSDPDDNSPSIAEIRTLFLEGKKLFSDMSNLRILRAYAGPRPLIGRRGGREAPRTFQVFDHEETLRGLISVAGGKLTTYRLMAEKVSDVVSKKLGIRAPCRTHKEPLPGYYDKRDLERLIRKWNFTKLPIAKILMRWGALASTFLSVSTWKNKLVCYCELVTYPEIKFAIQRTFARTIGDIMRRTRATMGPCQGQNCTYKISSTLYDTIENYHYYFIRDLKSHLRRRWAGMRYILNSHQANQAALQLALFNNLGNFNKILVGNDE